MNKGFIALTLVLSVAGILLGLVFASSIENAVFFDQAMRKEYRTINYYYAYDCLDKVILTLSHDYFFAPTSAISFPEFYCSIVSVEKQGDLRIITAVGNFMNALVYREAIVRLHDQSLEIVSIN